MCVYMYMCAHMCVYVWCVCLCVCMCVYASVYVYLGMYVWDACVQCVCGVYGYMCICLCVGFPASSAGKESACSAGDLSSIPVWGRSAGEGTGRPLQYSWVSLVAQLVKNPPAVQETSVRFLCGEDLLEKGQAAHSSIPGFPWWLSW